MIPTSEQIVKTEKMEAITLKYDIALSIGTANETKIVTASSEM